jgi:flagellar L-ring protein precursor FlgH
MENRGGIASAAIFVLSACSAVQRVEEIGDPPVLATLADPASPVNAAAPALPIPPPPPATRAVNSLWASGAGSFFHDPRASRPGDIITVNISIADAAKRSNTTSRTRTNADGANLTNFFGLEGELANLLPS